MKFRAICGYCYDKSIKEYFRNWEPADPDTHFNAVQAYYFGEEYSIGDRDVFYEIDVQDKYGFIVKCGHGHEALISLDVEIYELLFDRGIFAYQDKYYRESVVNFASSIERFHEYCIRLMLYSRNVDLKDVEETWKLLKQSERQYGAFVSLFLAHFTLPPPKVGSMGKGREWLSFRNNVVHNGHFPTQEEAIRAINVTLEYIHEVLSFFAADVDISGEGPNELAQYKSFKRKKIMEDLINKYEEKYGDDSDISKVETSTIYLSTAIRFMHDFNNINNYNPLHELKQNRDLKVHTYDEKDLEYVIDQFIEINKSGYKK